MRISKILSFVASLFLFATGVSAQTATDASNITPQVEEQGDIKPTDVVGTWLLHDKASIVEIKPCTDSVCGTLEWFPNLENATGPILDQKNSDETLRNREVKGIQLIYGFKETRKGWRKGRIYDPETGKTFKSKLTRLDEQNLRVEGCLGPLCQKFIWTKVK